MLNQTVIDHDKHTGEIIINLLSGYIRNEDI